MPYDVSGPLFDGTMIASAQHDLKHDIEQAIADKGVSMVRDRLVQVIRVNHGIYMSWIHTEDVPEGVDVTDRYIVYGPWLEGVGSRNSPVTRFRGYHTFRIVGQELQLVAGPIAEVKTDEWAAAVG